MRVTVQTTVGFSIGLLLLAGCGGSGQSVSPSIPPQNIIESLPGAAQRSASSSARAGAPGTFTTLYSFTNNPDGSQPSFGGLVNLGGVLYGMTETGGTSGDGTVFSITKSGAETVLHSFTSGADGVDPLGGLTKVAGTLYGVTSGGGANAAGMVFSITKPGQEAILYSFSGGSDGSGPLATLTNVSGTLYGTTVSGGGSGCGGIGCGTVFSITTAGVEKVIYRFAGGSDGAQPYAQLTNVGGELYGVTAFGGGCSASSNGCGTVFKVTKAGAETVLHAFNNSPDGLVPYGRLLNVGGVLYGTTYQGGTGTACSSGNGCGTVFSITKTGKETVLYNFTGGADGGFPAGGLINVGGILYGTASQDGAHACGAIFSITPAGAETTLYSFTCGSGGSQPLASLLNVGGTLYGMTAQGGNSSSFGTVFSFVP